MTYWKRDPEQPPLKRDVLPLGWLVGDDDDDDLEDLAKLLSSQGYTGFSRGPVLRFSWWPWR